MDFKQVQINCHVSTTAFHRGAPSNLQRGAIRGESREAEQKPGTDDAGGGEEAPGVHGAQGHCRLRTPETQWCARERSGVITARIKAEELGRGEEGQTEPSGDAPQRFHQQHHAFQRQQIVLVVACLCFCPEAKCHFRSSKHEASGTSDSLWCPYRTQTKYS